MNIQLELPVESADSPAAREWERRRELRYRAAASFERHYETRIVKRAANPENPHDCRVVYELIDSKGRLRRFDSSVAAERFLRRELRGNYQFTPSIFG